MMQLLAGHQVTGLETGLSVPGSSSVASSHFQPSHTEIQVCLHPPDLKNSFYFYQKFSSSNP